MEWPSAILSLHTHKGSHLTQLNCCTSKFICTRHLWKLVSLHYSQCQCRLVFDPKSKWGKSLHKSNMKNLWYIWKECGSVNTCKPSAYIQITSLYGQDLIYSEFTAPEHGTCWSHSVSLYIQPSKRNKGK